MRPPKRSSYDGACKTSNGAALPTLPLVEAPRPPTSPKLHARPPKPCPVHPPPPRFSVRSKAFSRRPSAVRDGGFRSALTTASGRDPWDSCPARLQVHACHSIRVLVPHGPSYSSSAAETTSGRTWSPRARRVEKDAFKDRDTSSRPKRLGFMRPGRQASLGIGVSCVARWSSLSRYLERTGVCLSMRLAGHVTETPMRSMGLKMSHERRLAVFPLQASHRCEHLQY